MIQIIHATACEYNQHSNITLAIKSLRVSCLTTGSLPGNESNNQRRRGRREGDRNCSPKFSAVEKLSENCVLAPASENFRRKMQNLEQI